ncbi:uridine diphosphate-N-acetylglucosamine-binding protein YvcK [bacterium]|nr:uridine diphosphate-N-acetylglucosamine-binding protein YvcK [bacterium]
MNKKIVTIGGGNGQPVLLSALRRISNFDITAIVTTMDNGGSTGKLCQQYNFLPVGDMMKCIKALYDDYSVLKDIFLKRFSQNEKLKGHNAGNMLLLMLSQHTDFLAGVKGLSEILNIRGKVLPVTIEKTTLCATYSDGSVQKGEHRIDEPENFDKTLNIERLFLEPSVKAYSEVIKSIIEADYIFMGPGDLYTSILPNLIIEDVAQVIKNTNAKIVFISNLITKTGQTHNMKVGDLINEIEKYIERKPDIVVLNNKEIPKKIIEIYKNEYGEEEIKDNLKDEAFDIVREDIVSFKIFEKNKGDELVRSILKHDEEKLFNIIKKIILRK